MKKKRFFETLFWLIVFIAFFVMAIIVVIKKARGEW